MASSLAAVDCALAAPPAVGLVASSPWFAFGSTCAAAASAQACFAAASAMFAQFCGAGAGAWASAGLAQAAPKAITDADIENREAVERKRILRVPSKDMG